jgi:hypothetical protein
LASGWIGVDRPGCRFVAAAAMKLPMEMKRLAEIGLQNEGSLLERLT